MQFHEFKGILRNFLVSDFGLNTTIEFPGQRRLFCTIVTFLDDTYHFTCVA